MFFNKIKQLLAKILINYIINLIKQANFNNSSNNNKFVINYYLLQY